MPKEHETFGQAVRRIRRGKRYRQDSFAAQLGVTRLTIARWEAGEQTCPVAAIVLAHAESLPDAGPAETWKTTGQRGAPQKVNAKRKGK